MTIGTLGYLLIITAFVTAFVSGLAFFLATHKQEESAWWIKIGRISWLIMLSVVFMAAGLLLYMLATHQFQYSYVYRYSSKDLDMHYLLSAFWAGQEGSFLLWVLFTGIVGALLFKNTRSYEPYLLSIIALCQVFLISMIAGVKFGTFTIGASPFITTADAFPQAPILQTPGFVPRDGQGLNDLLMNYWMVIHPPTLFAGFTLMIVPFAFAIAGLWRKQYTEWVKPAMPWALVANLVLMIGITMGGYWAYVTLSFGGYWAWDPVENSSLVPWIVGVAALHTMLAQKRSASSQKASIFLNILAFMLVVYSTFLTRSGILGELSVHSFVDLGLYNQLVIWILAMGFLGFGMMAYRWKALPKPKSESEVLSREFMILSGAVVLMALAAVIILGTSAPLVGRVFRSNPSAVPIEFYDQWSLPLAILMAFLAGIGQLFWWNKMNVENLIRVLSKPLGLAIASTALILLFTPFVEGTVKPVAQAGIGQFWAQYGMSLLLLLLIFTSFFALYGNGLVLWKIGRGNLKLVGGSLAHVGLVLMLFGIITSAAFNNPLSGDAKNSIPEQGQAVRNNFVISRGQTLNVEGYTVKYVKSNTEANGHKSYELNFKDANGRSFTVNPVAYKSKKMQWILHPDLKTFFEKDIYVAVTPSASVTNQEEQPANPNGGELKLRMGDVKNLQNGQYVLHFRQFDLNVDPKTLPGKAQIAVAALLDVTNTKTGESKTVRPVYAIMEDGKNTQQFLPAPVEPWGITFYFAGMDLTKDGKDGQIRLLVQGADVSSAEDWVIVQAYEKPFINLLWMGSIILFIGFGIAYIRRNDEKKVRKNLGRAEV